MSDLGNVLALWREALAADEDYVLATVTGVDGSSYRKSGARMLLTRSGRRAGGISGGCLEAEVSRKAWWLTERGPAVQRYSTFFDAEGEIPYGLGCGGTVEVLLERRSHADSALQQIAHCFAERLPCSAATVVDGEHAGLRVFPGETPARSPQLARLASEAAQRQSSFWSSVVIDGQPARIFAEYMPPRLGLFLFGAGDDAQPLAHFAHTLGWYTVVADGRAHLATRARFPLADGVAALRPGAAHALGMKPTDAAVLLTHSYEQDRDLLRQLVPLGLRYLGVLGPKRRTLHLVEAIAPDLTLTTAECMERLHSPVGLALGAEAPAAIALSIAAEIETALHQPSPAREPLVASEFTPATPLVHATCSAG